MLKIIDLNMPVDDSTLTKRHALKITTIYLLIRCIPELVLLVVNFLPADIFASLAGYHEAWLYHLYPVIPVYLMGVPFGFQQVLALLPVLIIEALLVFLFSAWFLRRNPAAAGRTGAGPWVMLALATLVWSCAIRLQVLGYVHDAIRDELLQRQHDANWLDVLSLLLTKAHWSLSALIHVTMPLWAGVPVWLHFRFGRTLAGAAVMTTSGSTAASASTTKNTVTTGAVRGPGMAVPLQRATVFASFLLGCLLLHIALVQAIYMGLWPWAVERSGAYVPLDMLDEISLQLSLSQIVVSAMVCALAAYIYLRRFTVTTTSMVRLVVKPLLSGAFAYLLMCFVFLALVWLVLWLNPGFMNSFLKQLSYAPESGFVFIIALNVCALILLCVTSDRIHKSPRRCSAVLAVLILCAAVPAHVGWTVTASNMGMAGGKPGFAVTGKLGDARWRSMEQWCTGVVETRHGTWLIGRKEESIDTASYVPDDVPDLSELVTGAEGSGAGRGGFGLFGSRPRLTTLSRLQDDGTFKVMAVIPEVACMEVSPDTGTLFLFTGVQRPQSPSSQGVEQTAVFRSSDHGMTWEWLESGFMPEVQHLAWSVRPVFASDHDVWAWGVKPQSTLFHSADQGRTSTAIDSPEPLVVPLSYLQDVVNEPEARLSSSRDTNQKHFIVQVNDERAYAWVSERMWYHVGEDSHRLMLTSRAELSRTGPGDEWRITHVSRQPDVAIGHLSTSLDGRTYATLHDKEGEWLVRLDTRNGEWIERQRTPALLPGWLADDQTSVRYFRSNGDYQVVSKWGYTVVPRILMPFYEERAEINTDAHFYTRDGGRNWHQLAIPDYLGVMGLSSQGSKLYWNKGDWYINDEPLQWEYDLAR